MASASGTVHQLLGFLDKAARDPELNPTTVQAMRSAWQSVTTQLGVARTTPLDKLDPDRLVDDFERLRGGHFRSGATYRTRLRVGQQLYQAWSDGDPHWQDVARTRAPRGVRRSLNRSGYGRPAVPVLQFPLRRDLTINIEVPEDLTDAEADRLAAFIKALVIPDRS